MGRVVITHSTYIKGLIEKLKKLAEEKKIKTITPGKIEKTKGRGTSLILKVTTETIGGFKLLARRGSSVQEIFIVTTLNRSELTKLLID